jgi:hypothetical protein
MASREPGQNRRQRSRVKNKIPSSQTWERSSADFSHRAMRAMLPHEDNISHRRPDRQFFATAFPGRVASKKHTSSNQ